MSEKENGTVPVPKIPVSEDEADITDALAKADIFKDETESQKDEIEAFEVSQDIPDESAPTAIGEAQNSRDTQKHISESVTKAEVSHINANDEKPQKKKKSVGFAAPPPELKDHHEDIKKIQQEKAKSHPFHKIPPELSYLEKKPDGPKPLPSFADLNKFEDAAVAPKKQRAHAEPLGDLRALATKVISVVNKQTEVNFSYPTIDRPIAAGHMIIDVKYASLNSLDLSKISKYNYNVSEKKIGLGYEFVGEISELGQEFIANDSEYKIGQLVFGCLDPSSRRGSLSSNVLANPKVDIVIPIADDVLEQMESVNVDLDVEDATKFVVDEEDEGVAHSASPVAASVSRFKKKTSQFPIEDKMSALAKFTAFPAIYSRAKTALSHSYLKNLKRVNILVNGADTTLGITILQLLTSSAYEHIEHLNLILVVRDSALQHMQALAKKFSRYDPTKVRKISVISFDLQNEDIVLPGEKVPINYKKPNFFACDVLEAMIDEDVIVDASNFHDFKLDLIVDIIGGSHYFQAQLSIKYDMIEMLSFPFLKRISPETRLSILLKSKTKEAFLVKIMKSKGSSFVAFCKYGLPDPTYIVDDLIGDDKESAFNPWSMKWTTGLANTLFSTYNYFHHTELETKRAWIEEALQLVLRGELKVKVNDYIDWRNNPRSIIHQMKTEDRKAIFKVESF